MDCVMDHIVLNVEDEDAMLAFYTEVLTLSAERLEEYRAEEVSFPSVRLNAGTIIDLFPKRLWSKEGPRSAGTGNLNHFCLTLAKSDWDQLRERLDAGEVAIERGPVPRWGARERGTSIYFRDPDGNLLEARHYAAQD